MPKLLTPKEVARILRVSLGTVYLWIRAGRLRAIRRPGSRILVSEDTMKKILENEREEVGPKERIA